MVSRVKTIAFQGVEAVPIDVQVMIAPGKMGIQIVGLADKAVAESRERVQAALHASGLSMPPKKVTVNLAPADLPKLNFGANCAALQDTQAARESCMADEERARARLANEWGRFAPATQNECTQLSSMKGFQSYVELLTCVEMTQDAKKLPKQ